MIGFSRRKLKKIKSVEKKKLLLLILRRRELKRIPRKRLKNPSLNYLLNLNLVSVLIFLTMNPFLNLSTLSSIRPKRM